MSDHPAIVTVVDRIHRDVIGGAADIAKEVVQALAAMVSDFNGGDVAALVAAVEDATVDIMRVTPSFAPPINTLHRIVGRMEAAVDSGATVAGVKAEIQAAARDFAVWAESAL